MVAHLVDERVTTGPYRVDVYSAFVEGLDSFPTAFAVIESQ